MKTILAAILLVTLASAATAEPRSRQIQFMCGSLNDVEITMEKYGEKMVLATQSPDEQTINLLYAWHALHKLLDEGLESEVVVIDIVKNGKTIESHVLRGDRLEYFIRKQKIPPASVYEDDSDTVN